MCVRVRVAGPQRICNAAESFYFHCWQVFRKYTPAVAIPVLLDSIGSNCHSLWYDNALTGVVVVVVFGAALCAMLMVWASLRVLRLILFLHCVSRLLSRAPRIIELI